jgi:hypothetical protein
MVIAHHRASSGFRKSLWIDCDGLFQYRGVPPTSLGLLPLDIGISQWRRDRGGSIGDPEVVNSQRTLRQATLAAAPGARMRQPEK